MSSVVLIVLQGRDGLPGSPGPYGEKGRKVLHIIVYYVPITTYIQISHY